MLDRQALRAARDTLYRDPAARPPRPPLDPAAVPAALTALAQWVCWRFVWVTAKGKWDKIPLRTDGRPAKSNDPATWASFGAAVAAARGDHTLDGIGFVFRAGGGLFGLDLDACRDPAADVLSPLAGEITARFLTYAELSPSGYGFKLFGRGELPGGKGRKNPALDLEVYPAGRFFTVTGTPLAVAPGAVTDCTAGLAWLLDMHFPAKSSPKSPKFDAGRTVGTSGTTPAGPPRAEGDAAILARVLADPRAARLWTGDTGDHDHDDSAADYALLNHLAFHAGPDPERIDRLFRQSQLCRPKWDERRGDTTYGAYSVARLLATKTDYYTPEITVTTTATGAATGGRPAAGPTRPDGWGPPAPLPTLLPVPPFPVGVFPAKVGDYWLAAAESLACPADYVAVPGLVLLGAAIGRSRAAGVKRGWTEPPLFWAAVFAPPGAAKSPALRKARGPLALAEARWLDDHRRACDLFDTEMERFNALLKDWKANGCAGEPPEKPRRPTLRQVVLDDATTEAAARVLSENPRGVCVTKDELIGFVRGLNQYKSGGKGADREFWLSCWAGATAKVNRAKDHAAGPLVIPDPFVGVAGMLCPDSLAELRGDHRGEAPADGFIDRFLLSFPDPAPAEGETWKEVPEPVALAYADVFADLLGVEMVSEPDGPGRVRYRPYIVPFDADGRAGWQDFTAAVAGRMNALDKFDPFRGVLSKLKAYAARFACLLWSVRRACGELAPGDPIGADTLAGAAALVDYFEAHGRRCMGVGTADRSGRVARRLLDWLARRPDTVAFSRSQAFLAVKDRRDVKSSESLDPAFRLLADHNFVRPLTPDRGGRPGPAAEVYAVNPGWVRAVPAN